MDVRQNNNTIENNNNKLGIDQGSYDFLKKALDDGSHEVIGRFVTRYGQLYYENDAFHALNTADIYRPVKLEDLKVHKITEKELIKINLILGNEHYDFGHYDDDNILITGDIVIFKIYDVSFQAVFGPSIGDYCTERAIAKFLVSCWSKTLTPEQLDIFGLDMEDDGNVNSKMIDLFPLSFVSCLAKEDNHGLEADNVYIVELAD